MSQRGLKNNVASNTTYLAMSNGEFVKRVKEETPASKSRQLTKGENAGSTVHEEHFTEFTGQLISLRVETHEKFGKSWAFKFDVTVDEPEFLILKLPYSSGYSNNLLTRLPNFQDFANDLTLTGYNFKPADKPKNVMGISVKEWRGETAEKIIPFYTKETPNGIPQMKEIVVSGNKVWDDTDRMIFLETMVNETIVPKLYESQVSTNVRTQETQTEQPAAETTAVDFVDVDVDGNGDALPF